MSEKEFDPAIQLALLTRDVQFLKDQVSLLDKKITDHYVLTVEFTPIKNIIYGLVGVILMAVIGAILSLIIRGQ